MKRTTPDERLCIVKVVKNCKNKSLVARLFRVAWNTVAGWCRRKENNFRDKPRHKEGKITVGIELSILALRNTLNWGSARIRQGLISLPYFILKDLPNIVQDTYLSRTAINNVLKKHKINGYKNKTKSWKFFRAKCPNELWQLDIKGPFTVQGKKYYFVICIDDYSRYMLIAEQLDHCPNVKEIFSFVKPLIKKYKPKKILTDNNPFREEWDNLCKENNVESLHAHLYYPQDKGKVERAIRNIAEEFIYLIKKFPHWLEGKIKDFQEWYNNKRYHYGIKDIPSKLFK
jgi:hypothetical protein